MPTELPVSTAHRLHHPITATQRASLSPLCVMVFLPTSPHGSRGAYLSFLTRPCCLSACTLSPGGGGAVSLNSRVPGMLLKGVYSNLNLGTWKRRANCKRQLCCWLVSHFRFERDNSRGLCIQTASYCSPPACNFPGAGFKGVCTWLCHCHDTTGLLSTHNRGACGSPQLPGVYFPRLTFQWY